MVRNLFLNQEMPMKSLRTCTVLAALLVLGACSGGSDGASAVSPTTAASSSASAAAVTSSPSSADPSEASTDDAAGETAKDVVQVEEGERSVDGDQVAGSVSQELTRIVGRRPDAVKCPDLKGKVGTSIRCTLTDGSNEYGVTVTATSVKGDDVGFGIKVDDQAQ